MPAWWTKQQLPTNFLEAKNLELHTTTSRKEYTTIPPSIALQNIQQNRLNCSDLLILIGIQKLTSNIFYHDFKTICSCCCCTFFKWINLNTAAHLRFIANAGQISSGSMCMRKKKFVMYNKLNTWHFTYLHKTKEIKKK